MLSHVLIIDDEPDGCAAVAGYLRKAGHAVRCVSSGREALDVLTEKPPDIVLLDVLMPGMDGIAVLKVMRSYLNWATIPVAVFTAYPEDPRLWDIARLGVTRVFAKSKVNLSQVLEWVEEQAGRAVPPPGIEPTGTQAGA